MIEVSREERLAALSTPHRLAIVDALAASDLSPSELGMATKQPSNLIAHHVKALENAGIVHRRRSDADARRHYLTLNWNDPIVAAVVAGGAQGDHSVGQAGTPRDNSVGPVRRVVFVCRGNSARSHMAASLLASYGAQTASAGTHPAAALHPFAVAELERRGLAPLAPRPRALAEVVQPGDRIVAVCDAAYEELGPRRAHAHWSIAATSGRDRAAFAEAFDDLAPRVERLAHALTSGETS